MAEESVSLKEYFDRRVDDTATRFEVAADGHNSTHRLEEMARLRAAESLDRRLENMNEVREEMRSQAATFLPRIVFDQRYDEVLRRVDVGEADVAKRLTRETFDTYKDTADKRFGRIEGQQSNWQGRLAMVAAVPTIFGVAAVVISVINLLS